jgi:hypothetical protein
MSVKNQTTVTQGSTVTLDVYFREYIGGGLVDPDSTPTYTVKNPSGTTVATGSGTRTSQGCYYASYAVASDATISIYWKIEWAATINAVAITDWEYFIVVSGGSIAYDDIQISDEWLHQIKKGIGYPDIDTVLLSDDNLKTLIIRQALYEFFTKFPYRVYTTYQITTESVIDFPDVKTFGVIHCGIDGKGYTKNSGSSFWDLIYWNQLGINNRTANAYGSRVPWFNPNSLMQSRYQNITINKTMINRGTFKYRVDIDAKKLYAYSSLSAILDVTWAKYSNNFDDIPFQFKFDVVKLASAYAKLHLSDTMELAEDSAVELKIDTATLKEKGNEQRQQVYDKWDQYPGVIVIRS